MESIFSSLAHAVTEQPLHDASERAAKTDFNNWTVNTPLLYDFVSCHVTEWPSMTVDCRGARDSGSNESVEEVILGSYTGGAEPNFLLVLGITLPTVPVCANDRIYCNHGDHSGFNFGHSAQKFQIRAKIPLPVEPNRALHMPQHPNLVAVVGPEGKAFVVDTAVEPDAGPISIVLNGHTREGWALAWNKLVEGRLVSADDVGVHVWDVKRAAEGATTPTHSYMLHSAAPQDLSWKAMHPEVFSSVGDDGLMQIVDIRDSSPVHTVACSSQAINTVCFNPIEEYLIATAGATKTVTLWDDRQLPHPLHAMFGHEGAVVRALFHPTDSHYLGTASQDHRVLIWDLRRIGMEQRADDAEDGPPELRFGHGGHVSSVNDISWTSKMGDNSMIVSVSDDNMLQVWQMNSAMFGGDDDSPAAESENTDFEVEVND